jgi:hypothetical protein
MRQLALASSAYQVIVDWRCLGYANRNAVAAASRDDGWETSNDLFCSNAQ